MCEWGDTVMLRVPIPASHAHNRVFRWADKPIDRCIAPIVEALNAAGLHTAGSCCGHGRRRGRISAHDGTEMVIERQRTTRQERTHREAGE